MIEDINPNALEADGFDEAVIGWVERIGMPSVLCYDVDMCINILIKRDGMTFEDAQEYMSFNVIGSYVGPHGPVWLNKNI